MIQEQLYFQRQGMLSLQCGLHSVNNLLGKNHYTSNDFNGICYQLSDSFINPHKHIFGGDYDANVLMVGLQRCGYDIEWQDSRKQFKINCEGYVLGYLINIKQKRLFYHKIFGISARHWVVLKKHNDIYYLLDSSSNNYRQIGNSENAQQYINSQIKQEAQVILIRKI